MGRVGKVMKELKTIKEVEDHIYGLEKQLFQLKNTHAYRVGMAIMNFYNKPEKFKILTLRSFLNELISSTKKKEGILKTFRLATKLSIPNNIVAIGVNNSGRNTEPSKQYYFIPYIKSTLNYLTIDTRSVDGIIITPNNFMELIQFGNFDEIKVDISILKKLPNWRGFGTYDDIPRTNKFLNILELNTNIKKTLIHNGDLILFPIILDRIKIFNEVVSEVSEV